MSSLPDAEVLDTLEDARSPHRHRSFGRSPYLYVIEIAPGRVKVGISVNVEQRLANHRRLAEAYGVHPGKQWVSYPGVGTSENEGRLIQYCAERAGHQYSREYFAGILFEAVVAYAEVLSGTNPSRRGTVRNPRNPTRGRLAAFDRATDGRVLASIAEAARWMDLSERRVQKLIESGELTLVPDTQGRGHRVSVLSMRKWLAW